MKKTDKMSRTVSQLEHMYNAINADFFQSVLPVPVITVQSKPGSFGHSSVAKVWKRSDDSAYELNIAAEVLTYPIEETIDTLIHEMVHIYCRENGIKEVSRNGSYHNKKFKEIAEAHGLTCFDTGKYGWNTKAGDNLIEYALSKGWSEFDIVRATYPFNPPAFAFSAGCASPAPAPAPSGKRPSSTRKLICPECKQSVRATKKVNIMCLDCMVKMIEV